MPQHLEPSQQDLSTDDGNFVPELPIAARTVLAKPIDEPDLPFIAEAIVEGVLDSVLEKQEPKSEVGRSRRGRLRGLFSNLASPTSTTGGSITSTNGLPRLQALLILVSLGLGLALIELLIQNLSK